MAEFGSFLVSVSSVTLLGDPCAGPGRSIRPAKKFVLSMIPTGFQRWNRSRVAPTFNSPPNSLAKTPEIEPGHPRILLRLQVPAT